MRTLGRFAVAVVLAGLGLALALVLLVPPARAVLTAGHTVGNSKIDLQPLSQRSSVYARDGSLLQVLHAEEDRVPVELETMPAQVVDAVLAVEDDRFWHHGPIDLRSMTRALVTNVSAGSIREGGSTITQQLVKNALLTPRQDLHRKLKEAVLAVRLSNQMPKRGILERYLNTVYFGNGAYGIQAAAERYFATDVGGLDTAQATLLAGLIRNPVGYDPFRFPAVSRQRRDRVVDRMVELGRLDAQRAAEVKAAPLPDKPADLPAEKDDYFTEVVKQQLLNDGRYRLGGTGQDRYRSVFQGGLKIHTTLDPRAQHLAEQKVREILPDTQGRFNAALVSVDSNTGAVRALVGGDNFDRQKFNLVTDGLGRPTGSSFKVFTLMAALERGHTPSDTIDGTSPCTIPNPGGVPNPWRPENVEGEEGGVMTLTDATVHSVNCAYARLVSVVGPRAVVDVARRMGVTNGLAENLSITLGTSEVTPLQMAAGYATLAADGELHRPYFVERIDDRQGETIYRTVPKGERAVSAQHARAANQILQQVVTRGTGRSAAVPRWPVAGKTGTGEEFRDAWFVGHTRKLTTAVWMGSPAGQISMYNVGGIRVYGGTYPARIWGAFMREALAGETPQGFPPPDPRLFARSRYLSIKGESRFPPTSTPPSSRPTASSAPPSENGKGRPPPPPPPQPVTSRSRPTLPPLRDPPRITRTPRTTEPDEPPPTTRRRRFGGF